MMKAWLIARARTVGDVLQAILACFVTALVCLLMMRWEMGRDPTSEEFTSFIATAALFRTFLRKRS